MPAIGSDAELTIASPQQATAGGRRRVPWAAVGFLMPNFLGLLLFTCAPVIFSFCIIFTNCNLKGTRPVFLGLRNLWDLVGVRPLQQGNPPLQSCYVFAAALLAGGSALMLWAVVSCWRGRRAAGVVLCALGLVTVLRCAVAAFLPGAHPSGLGMGAGAGWWITGVVFGLMGLTMILRDDSWAPGPALIPALMMLIGVAGLWCLDQRMWSTFEARDPRFWKYLYNTLFLMMGIPFSIAGSLGFALLLSDSFRFARKKRIAAAALCAGCGLLTVIIFWTAGSAPGGGNHLLRDMAVLGGAAWFVAAMGAVYDISAFRTLFYLPTFTSGVALMILWKSLYNPNTGMVNALLVQAGNVAVVCVNGLGAAWALVAGALSPAGAAWKPIAAPAADAMPQWLGSVAWAKPALIIMTIWTAIGGTNMLLYLAGLSNVPKELTDAAEVDGAGPWQRFVHVTWPQLAPTTFFICIMSIIGGLQGGFEQARVLTEGGPDGATTTLSYYIYNVFYQDLELGYGATIAWVLFGIIFVATAINWKYGKSIEVGP